MKPYRNIVVSVIFLVAATIVQGDEFAKGLLPHRMSAATIDCESAACQFRIELDSQGGIASLSAVHNGQTIKVPKDELPSLKQVDLRKLQVRDPWDNTSGPSESVVLVIPFQHEYRMASNKDESDRKVRVSNVVRLKFLRGEMVRWETAVSLGKESRGWALSFKNKGAPTVDNGKQFELKNPYWEWNFQNYYTEWE